MRAGNYGLAVTAGASTSAVEGHVEGVGSPHCHGVATLSMLYDFGAAIAGGQGTTGATVGDWQIVATNNHGHRAENHSLVILAG